MTVKRPEYAPEFLQDERGPFVRVPMKHDQYMFVDAADWPVVSQHYWSIKFDRTWYAVRQRRIGEPPGPSKIALHRILMNLRDGDPRRVDHEDGRGLNNRRYNLRICSQTQNTWNTKRALPPSGYRGVEQVPGSVRWCARVSAGGKKVYLGSFDTKEEAAAAYASAAKALRGEFVEAIVKNANDMTKAHTPTACERGEGRYHPSAKPKRNGSWSHWWKCPSCGRAARFLDRLISGRAVLCDGAKFTKRFAEEAA